MLLTGFFLKKIFFKIEDGLINPYTLILVGLMFGLNVFFFYALISYVEEIHIVHCKKVQLI